jgi:hypothetical protein
MGAWLSARRRVLLSPFVRAGTMSSQENTVNPRTETERDDESRPGCGNTATAQGEQQSPRPRTPNEHDESADHQATQEPGARRMGAIAHDDVVQGKQDTSKAQEMDATYRRMRREDTVPAQRKPAAKSRGR